MNSPALPSKFLYGRLSTFLEPFAKKIYNVNKQAHDRHSLLSHDSIINGN